MNTHIIRITFTWNDGPDSILVKLTTPKNLSIEKIYSIMKNAHHHLDFEEQELYEQDSRYPSNLLDYVCKQNN